ncbi:cytochrome b6-f complex iron-sulfur subunit [Aetokthonos hydrillicola Thurmond2011]|jgi:cytochrome b6-f complex iron-sulfur subunit|uniref:plastoquinol--plastocyanin reductase n=1 Tax=Aetokthonos hydrillicola Thurmond2011 TaxID=2712845 RepID=A0AAP5IAZ5_9CYAN|nr:cytochrome b6-f complex iron-sulfur subunit [Aetokthonos hydrillicola]MBO3458396.1 cytochrome b6-f complex iron-sulfur subunit [Aetokthonos hydrillicola CCALA 1050]MBW4586064.1 cytochrome b6-f complex iron-sulfur subunit [Aetokthonos hydrillicola CCALA 1050]MDR9897884.1 cytochrome b6-f complex iron-sulfur subunit [Aetokthonos hydrillicola Thurmond2011]
MDKSLPFEGSSLSRRQLLNFLTGASVATTAGSALYTVGKFFIPPAESTGEGGAIIAKDILGNPIPATQILAEVPGTRALVAGLNHEPTYLTVTESNSLDSIGIVDNCTHLGCTFPWNPMDQQFQCPCHGSLYAPNGTVVRGPAPLPLKIVHVTVIDNSILISTWTQTDPRTGEKPWWI